ncbi:MAG: acetyltransferase [Bacteriodetes bacterium]|nr:acetyltransferase [Bacteroidota bacterium]
MKLFDSKIIIAGAGGFAKEVLMYVHDIYTLKSHTFPFQEAVEFMVDDASFTEGSIHGVRILPQSEFSPDRGKVIIAIGSGKIREKIAGNLPQNTQYATLIHPTANVSQWTSIGEGAVITPGCIITVDTHIGKQSQINFQSCIAHDCTIGDFVTTAPGVRISGNCTVGNHVYFGTNAIIRQGISICDETTIGMGAVILNSLTQPGTYVGNPARKLPDALG